MAPRRRPRKLGTSRMDAAVDAMTPFGFPKDLVCAKMNALLEVYGEESGYPFIEADAYKVLIDTLLGSDEEESKQGEHKRICAEGETSMKNDSLGNGVGDCVALSTDGPAGGSIDSIGSETPNPQLLTDTRAEDGSSWKDIVLDETCSLDGRMGEEAADNIRGDFARDMHLHGPPVGSSPPLITSSPVPQSLPSRRRKPCYGWISDGEEEVSFVILTPAVIPLPAPTFLSNVTVKQTKRKTRWDIGPEDM